ncbi:MAG TPA: HIT domain-containing protein, partial [Thermomicrobiales bacterium]|nr:HIT domain-containing protein [Thermomicrobiales bacterium]
MSTPLPTPKPEGYVVLGERIAELRAAGICPTCRDIAQGDVFVDQVIVTEDEQMRVVLDQFPRAHGQVIVVWKEHHEDFTTLAPVETGALFTRCTEIAFAIKIGLGAEKIYLVTMCDGVP